MQDVLWLRFDAPLMSFGAPVVDQFGKIQEFPGLSLLAGLLGNALGYDHRDSEALDRLQARIRYAVRLDRSGEKLTDFQTVALGQDFLVGTGWTSRGKVEGRAGASSTETHIRYRDYWADSVVTVALTLTPAHENPVLDRVAEALDEPERPLFLGRKTCLPAARIFLGRTQAKTLREALADAPPLKSHRSGCQEIPAWWPADEEEHAESRLISVVDERDWKNQVHTGRRILRHGRVRIGGNSNEQ
ncbi:CRISPR system Cascade subunit CasD [compost metagenome]